jgi:amino-acid N-acetyltransferase
MKMRLARPEDHDPIRALLIASELPVEDVLATTQIRFLIVEDSSARLAGCVGFEVHGRDGILRSLAVRPSSRSQGVGWTLLKAVQKSAALAGIERLWLLTTTATTFFQQHGYEVADRTIASESVQQSCQFASICPPSSTCMVRTL